jgi:hypothetical protein
VKLFRTFPETRNESEVKVMLAGEFVAGEKMRKMLRVSAA